MDLRIERRLLQAAIAIACLVPIAAGAAGLFQGAEMIAGVDAPVPTDLDSHYRYLSGLLLGIGLCVAACIARIEEKGAIFAALCGLIILGGAGRLASLLADGTPSPGHLFGLAMELGVVPLLLAWQLRIARRFAAEDRGQSGAATAD